MVRATLRTAMSITDEISALDLPRSRIATLAGVLRRVAAAGPGGVDEAAIEALLGGDLGGDVTAEPLEALWEHAGLVVRAAVALALAQGAYGVEHARAVAALAHRLGVSAARLSTLEAAAFAAHRASGASAPE